MQRERPRKLFCDVEAEIVDPVSGQVVGLVYKWNTGERRKRWSGPKLKVYKLRLVDDRAGQHHPDPDGSEE